MSQGYWLAETTVTQNLWEQVQGYVQMLVKFVEGFSAVSPLEQKAATERNIRQFGKQ